MILLRKQEDLTNAEIASYQRHADKFFQAWVRHWQKEEGITNYINMIGSGHILQITCTSGEIFIAILNKVGKLCIFWFQHSAIVQPITGVESEVAARNLGW